MRRVLSIALLLVWASVGYASEGDIEKHSKIRVKTHPDSSWVEGMVVSINADSLIIEAVIAHDPGPSPAYTREIRGQRAFPLKGIERIEVKRKGGWRWLEVPLDSLPLISSSHSSSPSSFGEKYFAGFVGGVLGLVPSILVFASDPFSDYSGNVAAISYVVLSPLGSAAGVYSAGRAKGEIGSFPATWGGSVLGLLGGLAITKAEGIPGLVLLVAAPSVGATVGYNMTVEQSSLPLQLGLLPKRGYVSLCLEFGR